MIILGATADQKDENPRAGLFMPDIPLRMPARWRYRGLEGDPPALAFDVVPPSEPVAPIPPRDGVAVGLITVAAKPSEPAEPVGARPVDDDGRRQSLPPDAAADWAITALLAGTPIEYDTREHPNGAPRELGKLLSGLLVGEHVGAFGRAAVEMGFDANERAQALEHVARSIEAFRRNGSTALYDRPHVPFPWSTRGGAWWSEGGQPVLFKVGETADGYRLEDTAGGVYEPHADPRSGVSQWRLVKRQRARQPDRVEILSAAHYSGLQRAMRSPRGWATGSGGVPTKRVTRGTTETRVELRPPDTDIDLLPPQDFDALVAHMDTARRELTDADVDTLDALTSLWMARARQPEQRVEIFLDEVLEARGVKRHRAGSGRRGGYSLEKRNGVRRSLWRLHCTHVAAHMDVPGGSRGPRLLSSPAFVFTGARHQFTIDGAAGDIQSVNVTPGDAFEPFLFGPGRQVAILSAKALTYDAGRFGVEKRLTRWLAYRWRCGAKAAELVQRHRVATLVDECDVPSILNRPQRQRDRLESALDRIEQDGIIAGWQYADGWTDDDLPRRGWLPTWHAATILIEAPDPIKEAYGKLAQHAALLPPKPAGQRRAAAIGAMVRTRRKALGLTQLQLAEDLGMRQPLLSQAENGRACSKATAAKLSAWLEANPEPSAPATP